MISMVLFLIIFGCQPEEDISTDPYKDKENSENYEEPPVVEQPSTTITCPSVETLKTYCGINAEMTSRQAGSESTVCDYSVDAKVTPVPHTYLVVKPLNIVQAKSEEIEIMVKKEMFIKDLERVYLFFHNEIWNENCNSIWHEVVENLGEEAVIFPESISFDCATLGDYNKKDESISKAFLLLTRKGDSYLELSVLIGEEYKEDGGCSKLEAEKFMREVVLPMVD